MSIKPLGNRVLIRANKAEEKTESGLYIPDTAQEKTHQGVVLAVGSSEDITVGEGDTVLYEKYSGTPVQQDGHDCVIIDNDDIIAIVKE